MWLPPLSLLVAVFAIVVIAALTWVIYMARDLFGAFVRAERWKFDSAAKEELPPDLSRVPLKKLLQGMQGLEQFILDKRPDWIVGVHPGGRLLSVYVADKAKIPLEKCLFGHTEPAAQRAVTIRFPQGLGDKTLRGVVLIVDDITRKGTTLNLVANYLELGKRKQEFQFDDHLYAVLLRVTYEKKSGFPPDWYKFTTKNRDIKFPWSTLSEKISKAFDVGSNRTKDLDKIKRLHEMLAEDATFALRIAKAAIENNDAFEEMLQSGKIYEQFVRPKPVQASNSS